MQYVTVYSKKSGGPRLTEEIHAIVERMGFDVDLNSREGVKFTMELESLIKKNFMKLFDKYFPPED
jgi:hypothetical protein